MSESEREEGGIVVIIVGCVHSSSTVEPLYNGHFGTSHFWVIFAVTSRFSSFRGKNVLAWYHWDCKTCKTSGIIDH